MLLLLRSALQPLLLPPLLQPVTGYNNLYHPLGNKLFKILIYQYYHQKIHQHAGFKVWRKFS